jgi:hypothetical protein
MNVYEEPGETAGAPAPRNLLRKFKALPASERLLAAAACTVIVGYVIRGDWGRVGRSWFDPAALLGALGALGLVAHHALGLKALSARVRMYTLAICGVVPAAGFVVEMLSHDAWQALMLAGGVAMGLSAVQIAERESLPGQERAL